MKITFIGAGFVGTVGAACFAKAGHVVTVLDTDEAKIRELVQGKVPFHEPGLDDLVREGVACGLLRFLHYEQPDMPLAAFDARVIFLAVGTPSDERGAADMSAVMGAARSVDAALRRLALVLPPIVVIRSTCPVGSANRVAAVFEDRVVVLSNPEFLAEGSAVQDFQHPSRVVIGRGATADGEEAARVLADLYTTADEVPVHYVSRVTAEFAKYAANGMLATRISFMNELSEIAARAGADIDQVAATMGDDPRIGRHFLQAGVGFGGSCFGKDVKALARFGEDMESPMAIARAVLSRNQRQREVLADLILRWGWSRVLLLGCAFKPGTDDVRDSPTITVAQILLQQGREVALHDPMPRASRATRAASASARSIGAGSTEVAYPELFENLGSALRSRPRAIVLMTAWPEYTGDQLIVQIRELAPEAALIDARGVLDPARAKAAGVHLKRFSRSFA